ncbi:MAG: prepilin-type N-terminal cleavage/methylation domain-containing protein [Planctomycetota bacterium]
MRRSPSSGFTLVEVLLVLLIMGGIMLSMTQILTAARTSRDTIHNIQETQNAGPAILDSIERDLRGVLTYDATRMHHLRVKNRVTLGFDADSLDFVTTTDSLSIRSENDRFVRADGNEVGYRLRPSPYNDQFLEIYRREGYAVDDKPFEGGTFLLLHDRVKGFEIQCWTEDGPDAEPVDEWAVAEGDENIGLPARIEISLTLELAPRIVNEQLIVAPIDRRTIVYKRVIRLPETLRREEEMIPIPVVPRAPAPSNPASTTTGGPASGGTGGRTGGGGGTGGGGNITGGTGSGSPPPTPP